MSNRALPLPQLAMSELISSIDQRIMSAKKHLRWPGAVQFANTNVPASLVDTVWTDALSLSLDPGRWLVIGQAAIRARAGAGTPGFHWSGGARLVASGGSLQQTTIGGAVQYPATLSDAPLFSLPIHTTVEFSGIDTVALQVVSVLEAGSATGDAELNHAFMIGYPI